MFKIIGDYALNEIPEKPTVVSGGIGEDLLFEQILYSNYDANITCYDFVPKAIRYAESCGFPVNLQIRALSNKPFIEYFDIPDEIPLVSTSEFKSHVNNRPQYNISTISCLNIHDLIKIHGKIDILKLDIEGSEYGLLSEMDDFCFNNINQICGEFHAYQIPELKNQDKLVFNKMESLGYNTYIIDYNHHIYLFYKDNYNGI